VFVELQNIATKKKEHEKQEMNKVREGAKSKIKRARKKGRKNKIKEEPLNKQARGKSHNR